MGTAGRLGVVRGGGGNCSCFQFPIELFHGHFHRGVEMPALYRLVEAVALDFVPHQISWILPAVTLVEESALVRSASFTEPEGQVASEHGRPINRAGLRDSSAQERYRNDNCGPAPIRERNHGLSTGRRAKTGSPVGIGR